MQRSIQVSSAPQSPLYSQAIAAGDFLFLSGQIGIDPLTHQLVLGGIREQTQRVFCNIEAILEGAGLTLSSIVRIEIFLKEINDLPLVNKIYLEKIPHSPKPVRQTIQVAGLPFDALVEISCVALF